jgi:predicted phage terminase large subunit-like protein
LTPALAAIDRALVDVAEGRCRRLMVMLSPQEGKTSLVAQVFPLWLLTFRPDARNAIASYEQTIAERNGRRIRDLITANDGTDSTLDMGLRVQRGDHAAARWTLEGHDGGVVCVGIGAALTGRAVTGVLVVDDPIKDHEQAMSSAYRERVYEWWRSVARTRLSPDAAVVLIMTRWHASDLAGKLLEDASEPWRVLSIPAIADSPDDPLGREIGEPMISARGRTLEDWESTRRAVGEYVWNSLYQQRPAPLEGGIFKRDRVKFWRPVSVNGGEALDLDGRTVSLADCWTFLVADLAASTKTSADYTVIATFALWLDGQDLILLDLRRERMQPSGHLDAARPMFTRWNAHTLYIESTFQSATLVYEATRAGIPVSELKADTDKVTRALPAAARVDQGRVWVPQGASWVPDFLDELAAFPNGAHDDQCDVLGYAARVAAADFLPTPTLTEQLAYRPAKDEFERQLDAMYGPPVDFLKVQW